MYCIVITTTNSKPEAKRVSNEIISKKLAACVQISTIESIYEWNGEICNSREFRLVIKTKNELYKQLEEFILKRHSYEVPEIVQIPIINAYKEYLDWIDTSLS